MKKQNNSAQTQRRQFVRIPEAFILSCSKMSLGNAARTGSEKSATQNISAGGALFQSQKKFSAGDVLKLEILIPGWERFKNEFYKPDQISSAKPLIVIATVVRVESVAGNVYDTAVKFAGIDPDHQQALIKYILGFLSK